MVLGCQLHFERRKSVQIPAFARHWMSNREQLPNLVCAIKGRIALKQPSFAIEYMHG